LKVGVPAPPSVEPGGGAAETDVTSSKDVGGNTEGPIMGISDVKTNQTSDPEVETNLTLEIGIKKQPGAVIDHNKVKILVFLYDVVNDKDIKLTDADVSNEWLTSKARLVGHQSGSTSRALCAPKNQRRFIRIITFGSGGKSSAGSKGSQLKRFR
jgi:hypothetical protein